MRRRSRHSNKDGISGDFVSASTYLLLESNPNGNFVGLSGRSALDQAPLVTDIGIVGQSALESPILAIRFSTRTLYH